jgi:hypothetical protein
MDPLLTVPEVAAILRMKPYRVYELTRLPADKGGLPIVRIGRSVRVLESELQKWILAHAVTNGFRPRKT